MVFILTFIQMKKYHSLVLIAITAITLASSITMVSSKESQQSAPAREKVSPKELLAYFRDQDVEMKTNDNKIVALNLEGKELTAKMLANIVKCKHIEFLILDSTNITDKGLKEIVKLTNLKALWLDFTEITEVGLAELANLKKLSDLDIEDIEGSLFDGLKSIEKFTSLKSLELINNGIGDECIESLSKMKNLEHLWIIEGNNLSAKGLVRLKSALPKCLIH